MSNVKNGLSYEELKNYSIRKIAAIKEELEFRAKESFDKARLVKKPEDQIKKVSSNEFDLVTPSLIAAFEAGVLTKTNYTAIKNGGLMYLERYIEAPEGVKKCYESIKVPTGTEKIIIIDRDNESFLNLVHFKRVQFQKEKVEFEKENKVVKFKDDQTSPSTFDYSRSPDIVTFDIFGATTNQNTLQCLFQ